MKTQEADLAYASIIKALAEKGLLYFTADRGPVETHKEALEAGVGTPTVVDQVSRWTLEGQATGHEWYLCPGCGELRLMTVKARRICTSNTPLLPPRCRGRMERIAPRPVLAGRIKRWLAS